MKKILLILLFPIYVFSQELKENEETEIYIKLKVSKSNLAIVNIENELGFVLNFSSKFTATKPFFYSKSDELKKIYRLKFHSKIEINSLILSLKNNSAIEYVENIYKRSCISTPNDPSVTNQWSLTKIKAFEAWDLNGGNQIIKIAVVDNAIQTSHYDLQSNMLSGFDVADNDSNPNPPNDTFNHGTHVAGIIGAVSNNSIGIASVGNNKIKIIPVKTTGDLSSPNNIDFGYEGIIWAADNGANIINCSWGGTGYSQTEKLIIDYAIAKGCIVVAAAGNNNTEEEFFPAAYPNVISVASSDIDDKKSSFSTFGNWIDISAPGRAILSTLPTNIYGSFNGTSMASPLVAASLGFIWSCKPSLSPAQLETLIKATSDKIETLNPNYIGKLGSGRVNLLKAIACQELNLIEAKIIPQNSTNFCAGDTVILNSNGISNQNFEWYRNEVNLDLNQFKINVNSEGNYQLKISSGFCSILSKPISTVINKNISPNPTVTNKNIPYCSTNITDKTLEVVVQNCDLKGPKTFNYNGGQIGYDNYLSSGPNPSIFVSDLGGNIENLSVAITWQKKDQGLFTACGLADQGSVPYNEELSFKLKSPTGKIIKLINSNTYSRGSSTSGIVTTIFQDGFPQIIQGSNPISGTFGSSEPLIGFQNEIPVGNWELIPEDNSFGDPLCVSSFSLSIETDVVNSSPSVSWFETITSKNLLGTGLSFNSTAINPGKYNYFVESKCEGGCKSVRIPIVLEIKNIPEIKATKVQPITSPNATYYSPNLTSPITICENGNYVLTAIGCGTNNVIWSNNSSTDWIHINSINNDYYTAKCANLLGGCPILDSNPFEFVMAQNAITEITQDISANSNQTFIELKLKASNKIETPSIIEYRGIQSIELKPGFEVSANTVFKAEIKGCSN